MADIQMFIENGEYTCNSGITALQWKAILHDTSLMNADRLDMLTKFYNEPGHKSTCRTLADKYDKGSVSASQKYNSLNTQLGKAICKKYSLHFKRVDNGADCFWIVAMTGRDLENGRFEWKLQPEVVKAIEENLVDSVINQKLLSQMKTEKYIKILEKNHNIVLTGAPGTGKTYLAKTIAQAMNAKFEMVQFHPSYDYTDFVEGLRPTPPDNNGNIGFKRTSGIFWKFCEMALKSKTVDGIDNFEDSWATLVATLNDDNKDYVDIPMISGKSTFRIELNEYGTGLATRTYENDEPDKGNWIKGKSKFFSKDQLYNIYRGLKGIPSGGHDNYRKAVIAEMKKNYGLKEYKQGFETQTPTKYVFIVDEINRGELSKIFGELFFSIDPSYRGVQGAVKTQYSNMHEQDNAFDEVLHSLPDAANYPSTGWFFVPNNVYIIGTMNDIDRSVESMDFALRRRFRWCEILADEMQNEIGLSTAAKQRMANLNATIVSEEIGLSRSYCIGASYFKDIVTDEDFEELWDLRLSGLLYEYFRGMDDADDKLEILKEAYNSNNK